MTYISSFVCSDPGFVGVKFGSGGVPWWAAEDLAEFWNEDWACAPT